MWGETEICPDLGMLEITSIFLSCASSLRPEPARFCEKLGYTVIRGYDLLWGTPVSQLLPTEAVKTAAPTSIHPSLGLNSEAEPGIAGCGEHWRRFCAHGFRSASAKEPRHGGGKGGRLRGA